MRHVVRAIQVAWHWLGKSFTFFTFGLSCLLGAALGFPLLRLLVHPGWRFRRVARWFIRATFWLMLNFLRAIGLMRVKVINKDRLRAARGMVVVASHPMLVDVTILLAMVRQGNAIVRGDMWTHPVAGGVISQIFIPQFREFEAMTASAKASLDEGDNLIIFPEGTRTVRGKINILKRGAAQLALRTGHDILPIRMRVADSSGMAKHDSYFDVPQTGCYHYTIEVLEPIVIAPFLDQEAGIAARTLTKHLQDLIVNNPANEVSHGFS